jgi:hypothetical protein
VAAAQPLLRPPFAFAGFLVGGKMTTGGWILMSISLVFVWSLVGWCYYKILSRPPKEIPESTKDFHSA